LLLQFRDTQNIAVRRLVRDLSLALPLSKAVAWRQGILVLNRYEKAGSTGREERLARVNDVTGTHSFSGGVSNSFPSIWELPPPMSRRLPPSASESGYIAGRPVIPPPPTAESCMRMRIISCTT
jgi:hypothetical protein